MTLKYLKPDGTWHLTREEVEHINTLNEQIDRLTADRDRALALLRQARDFVFEWTVDPAASPDPVARVAEWEAVLAEIDALLETK